MVRLCHSINLHRVALWAKYVKLHSLNSWKVHNPRIGMALQGNSVHLPLGLPLSLESMKTRTGTGMATQKGTCQHMCGLDSGDEWVELGFNAHWHV